MKVLAGLGGFWFLAATVGELVHRGAWVDGSVRTIDQPNVPPTPFGTFPLRRLNPLAPGRVFAGLRLLGVRPNAVAYLLVGPDVTTDALVWRAYLKGVGDHYYVANAAGRDAERRP